MTDSTRNIITWIVSGLLSVAFLLAGASKVFIDPAAAAEQFQRFGLPGGMAMFIGACEMAGAIGLVIPKLAGLAASGLVIIMLGAIYSHVSYDPLVNATAPLVIGLLCGYVIYRRGLPFGSTAAA